MRGADADTLPQRDLATGGSKPNGKRLGGKGAKPVSSQPAFVPFFPQLIAEGKVLQLLNTRAQLSLSGGAEPK